MVWKTGCNVKWKSNITFFCLCFVRLNFLSKFNLSSWSWGSHGIQWYASCTQVKAIEHRCGHLFFQFHFSIYFRRVLHSFLMLQSHVQIKQSRKSHVRLFFCKIVRNVAISWQLWDLHGNYGMYCRCFFFFFTLLIINNFLLNLRMTFKLWFT